MLELASRRARRSGGHQKDGPEPVPQRLSSCVGNGIGGYCSLMQTTRALIFASRGDKPGPIMVVVGTAKPIRPFALDGISQTVLLGAKAPSELVLGSAIYKVHLRWVLVSDPYIIQRKCHYNE
jgi:hypothetical protein